MTDIDHYKVLGLPRDAAPDDIKDAYMVLSKQVHPDVIQGNAEAFMRLNKAYRALFDPESREAFDAQYDSLVFEGSPEPETQVKEEEPLSEDVAPAPESEECSVHGSVGPDMDAAEGMSPEDREKVRKLMFVLLSDTFEGPGVTPEDLNVIPVLLATIRRHINEKEIMLLSARQQLAGIHDLQTNQSAIGGGAGTVVSVVSEYETMITADILKLEEFVRVHNLALQDLNL